MSLVDPKHVVLSEFLDVQLGVAPEQEKFFKRRLAQASEADLATLNDIAGHVKKLAAPHLREHAEDYAWLCQEQIAEELHFRREGRYRLNNFQEAYDQVYSNKEYMTRYMNGLLMTQLWWSNHTAVMTYYRNTFLANNKDGYSHLEIGPGHGLFLYFAAADPRSGDVHSWDISEASIALTKDALLKLGLTELPKLELVDLFKGPTGNFDSIVFSEVLEHMEQPKESLEVIRSVLAPDGRLFINMPINSPAPDHLFNAETPEALGDFIKGCGYKILDQAFFPATNQTLEDARRKKLTISCVFIVGKA